MEFDWGLKITWDNYNQVFDRRLKRSFTEDEHEWLRRAHERLIFDNWPDRSKWGYIEKEYDNYRWNQYLKGEISWDDWDYNLDGRDPFKSKGEVPVFEIPEDVPQIDKHTLAQEIIDNTVWGDHHIA